ncbi:hypothetical protein CPB83DRAFT_544525 [Crepidotus variabilis]|uniref:Uncharacterized protein n=1 Tax=Crepidotus variabilis TaxID=179855 RepID=A0A9P6EAL0_9AGAR|nr:hypothetical protein CPB83DRAFT_544525 [Crepidotus variabilis]
MAAPPPADHGKSSLSRKTTKCHSRPQKATSYGENDLLSIKAEFCTSRYGGPCSHFVELAEVRQRCETHTKARLMERQKKMQTTRNHYQDPLPRRLPIELVCWIIDFCLPPALTLDEIAVNAYDLFPETSPAPAQLEPWRCVSTMAQDYLESGRIMERPVGRSVSEHTTFSLRLGQRLPQTLREFTPQNRAPTSRNKF